MSDLAAALGPAAQDIIADSPELRSRIENLIELTIDSLEDIMVDGTPTEQIALATKLAPFLFRKAEAESVDGTTDDKAEVRSMLMSMWDNTTTPVIEGAPDDLDR